MEPQDMIMVVEEENSQNIVEPDKRKSRKVNKGCQTRQTCGSEASIPVLFCALFSSACEASTQTNIPSTVSIGVSVTPSEITSVQSTQVPENTLEQQLTSYKKERHTKKTVDNVVNSAELFGQDGCNEDDCDPDKDSPFIQSPNDGNGMDIEDSDFSSDNDVAFWSKMKKLTKSRKKTKNIYSGNNLRWGYKYISYPDGSFKNDLLQNINESEPVHPHILTMKETDGRDDGWITDNEVDDENIDINQLFKQELKKKRHPYNSKQKNFVCEVCGKLYSKHNYLREHIVRDHKDHELARRYPYSCQHCKRLYSGIKQLEHHKQRESGPCEVCGVKLKCCGQYWMHRRNHHIKCASCGKSFNTRNSLEMHIKIKHEDKTVPCPMCPRMFSYKFLVKTHISKVHLPGFQTPHKCNDCDFSATTTGALGIHKRRMHSLEPEHTCVECKAKFSTRYALEIHMSQYGDKDVFTCSLCPQTFNSLTEFRDHRKAHSRVKKPLKKIKRAEENAELSQDIETHKSSTCGKSPMSQSELSHHEIKSNAVTRNEKDWNTRNESIQVTELDENSVSVMQIDVTNDEGSLQGEVKGLAREEATLNLDSSINYTGTRSALLMPADVVPPDVSMVDIDGVQYHVIRGNQ